MKNVLVSLLVLSATFGTPLSVSAAGVPLHGNAGTRELMHRVSGRKQERLVRRKTVSVRTIQAGKSLSSTAQLLQRRQDRLMMRAGNNNDYTQKQEMLDGVNMERALQGHPALRMNAKLAAAAQGHADDMAARNYFDHADPEGLRVGERVRAAGYGIINAQTCRCSYRISIGEDLAKGQTSVRQVIAEWMASPSHREAILSPDYDEIGIGIAGDIWVLNFGGMEIMSSAGAHTTPTDARSS